MFDFPASPTTGTVSNGYVYDGVGWTGGPGVSGPVSEQFFDVSGLTQKDVPVPTWAKGVDISVSIIPTGTSVLDLRLSTDGTTFSAGASDYAVSAPYHVSLPTAGYTTQPLVARSSMTLSIAGANLAAQQLIDAFVTLERPSASHTWAARSYSRSLDTASGSSTAWFYSYALFGSALRVAALRFLGSFGTSSFIRVKWIGDSAAIPQSNAIADAPNDTFQYLRGQNAWNSGGRLSSSLYIDAAAWGAQFNVNITDTVSGGVFGFQRNGKNRWDIRMSGDAESGSNAGSTLAIGRSNDAGTIIDFPLTINRANGVVALANGFAASGVSTMSNSFRLADMGIGGGTSYSQPIYMDPSGYTGMYMQGFHVSGNRAGVQWVISSGVMDFDNNGNIRITGATGTKASGTTWANPSDERIKEDIKDYLAGLDAICGLRPVMFRFKEETKQTSDVHVGLIAQEAEIVMPSIVTTTQGGMGDLQFDDFKSLDASNVIWALVNAVRELKAKVESLEGV